jgi:hypothetical protein
MSNGDDYQNSNTLVDNTNNKEYLQKYIPVKDKNNSIIRTKLIQSRKYFNKYPCMYILLKFFIGLILFTIPILLFCVTFKKVIDEKAYSYIHIVTFPLFFAVISVLVFIVILIFSRCCVCNSEKYIVYKIILITLNIVYLCHGREKTLDIYLTLLFSLLLFSVLYVC